jgi:hypothetical protein
MPCNLLAPRALGVFRRRRTTCRESVRSRKFRRFRPHLLKALPAFLPFTVVFLDKLAAVWQSDPVGRPGGWKQFP